MPLSPNWWLYKRPEKQNLNKWCAVKPIPNSAEKRVDFELIKGKKGKGNTIETPDGDYNPDDFSTIARGVGKCLNCNEIIEDQVIKNQAANSGLGHQFYAVAFKQGKGSLEFRTPNQFDLDGVQKAQNYLKVKINDHSLGDFIPDAEIPKGEETERLPKIGIEKWDQLFNPRQLLTLVTHVEIINEAKEKIRAELGEEKLPAIITYLAFIVDRCVDTNCRLSTWDSSRAGFKRASTQHALNLMWNYPETSGKRELWDLCANVVSAEYQGLCELLGTRINSSSLNLQVQNLEPSNTWNKDLSAQIEQIAKERNLEYNPRYLPYKKN